MVNRHRSERANTFERGAGSLVSSAAANIALVGQRHNQGGGDDAIRDDGG